jgi:hypothetical protein
MSPLLDLLFGFPTVIFTVLLGFVLLYWLLVALGALDLEILDLGGAFEAADGALDGVFGAETGVEGAAEVAAGAGGGPPAGGADAAHAPSGVTGVLHALGIHGVPLTVSLSLVILISWALTALGVHLLRSLLPGLGEAAGVTGLVAVAALAAAVFVSSRLVRPLRPAFATVGAPQRAQLVGRLCTVLSARVDATTGRAEIDDGAAGLLVEVRCFEDNNLTRGVQALVFDYDRQAEVFHVVPAERAQVAAEAEAG